MRHFKFAELIKSGVAKDLGINNMPSEIQIIDNLDKLISEVLEPLRLAYGKPIYISSGYRCAALNKAVGGVSNSYHLQGRAADITSANNAKLFALIKQLQLPYTELIAEKTNANGVPTWIHIAL